ncbi:MAG TPA: hypothetical protein VNB64_11525 [Solirubrobacteraceae bacterium]|nr:hypothetical protein [Solirubrobacteraceae bacterium]
MDLGAPVSYLVLETGVPVYDSARSEVGRVEHVLAAEEEDIFDGIVIDGRAGPGGWRFADADQIGALYERGVVLAVGADALHDPEAAPGVLEADPGEAQESPLAARLRRAWDLISGNY